jgi:hypothetical protein
MIRNDKQKTRQLHSSQGTQYKTSAYTPNATGNITICTIWSG